ncbi:TRAP-type mannitol/chloroaromatic compound transport system, substrate-binding protein [Desulfacinum hydrothermale DSM 13146]|uniref:TRAP-type mannitol/chloroaromatic compound transport system, substrate-binding protein n=1 Tax=Desulfacinum hydrothermale DSM 13146 TaxID=1121390 RepID=A0A1W1XE52_9BACT|nr:TRAP transporter substrate-binding protein [Desulfacinum hydrothermale]SMC22064.1 TRAP-type mannitol/chloroaromatic compound transport system, substrate-binding protein [Desulfacinum hydrothermale DSM 13146]
MFRRAVTLASCLLILIGCSVATAAQYELKIQTAVPSSSMYFKTMERLGQRIERLSGGEIKVEVFADGAIVKAFEILDAVSDGIVNGGQAWTHYWSGKNPAGLLFAAPTAGLGKGLDQTALLSWAWEGDGHKLLNEYYQKVLGADIVAWLCMPMGPEPFGWFPKKFQSMEELTKMKFRSPPGIPSETFREIGMPVVSMPGSEIVPAAQRGVIDAAEWISPGDDLYLGLADVWKHYYIQGLHQVDSIGDVYINKEWYESLPERLQVVIQESIKAAVADQINMNVSVNSAAIKKLVDEKGVQLHETPEDYYKAYMKATTKILDKYSAKYPFFQKVRASLEDWAELTVPYQVQVNGAYYKMGKTAMEAGAVK